MSGVFSKTADADRDGSVLDDRGEPLAITCTLLRARAPNSPGWGFHPAGDSRLAVLVGIASLLALLALSSFGLYSLQPPARLLRRVGGAGSGVFGSFFMGLTMGMVAAPCVGPIVVGLLLAVGTRGDPRTPPPPSRRRKTSKSGRIRR